MHGAIIMKQDLRGEPVSTGSAEALAAYETALAQFHGYTGDPLATIDGALSADPHFVVGHLFKVFVLYTTSEQRYARLARESLAAAEALEHAANARERGLLAAARALVAGQWDGASRALDAVLRRHPRDALAIQTAHLMDFYRGDALNLNRRIARVLPAWDERLPGYSYVLGMQAFGLEEAGHYAAAEAAGRRALELQPADGWAVHAVTHVMEMQGRIDEGIAWLTSRQADWSPADGSNLFAAHNWWHLALFHLDRGEYDRVLELYDAKLAGPQADAILVLVDCTALLWRLRLEGVAIGDRFEQVADRWQARLDDERGFYAFNDVHAMMSFAATGRRALASRLQLDMGIAAQQGTGSNRMMTAEVGLPLAQAFRAHARGAFRVAADLLDATRDGAWRFGGSHAQRDLLSLTLIDAALRAGDTARAQYVLNERVVLKPTAWSARLAERVRVAGGREQARA
jgi:tetratricopeptide (TPR) repeat protein